MDQAPPPAVAPRYDIVGLGVASWDLVGVAASEPVLGAKQALAQWLEGGGGPVATALVTASRLGLRCCMAGAVGDDDDGQRIIAELQREGVATAGMRVRPGSSHVAFVLAEPGNDRRTIWWHHDRAVLDGFSSERALVASARALHIDTHLPEAAMQAAQWMHEAGGIVMLDAERWKDSTLPLLPHCDFQVVSERFGRELTGEAEPERAAQALHAQYGKTVVVTAGERGSWCASHDEAFHTPAFAVELVDTTGAGDVFHGAFLYGLLQDWTLRKVARFASAVAALKCRAPGGRRGIPKLEEIGELTGKE